MELYNLIKSHFLIYVIFNKLKTGGEEIKFEAASYLDKKLLLRAALKTSKNHRPSLWQKTGKNLYVWINFCVGLTCLTRVSKNSPGLIFVDQQFCVIKRTKQDLQNAFHLHFN